VVVYWALYITYIGVEHNKPIETVASTTTNKRDFKFLSLKAGNNALSNNTTHNNKPINK
jgi:hypothetical protein